MTDTQLTLQILLSGLFFTSAIIMDLYQEKIPNKLCLLAIFCGFAINAYYAQLAGVLMASFGFGLAFILLFPTFILRILGAGDIKLMMGIGALMGPELLLSNIVYGIVAGAGTSLILIIWKTGFIGLAKTFKRYWDCIYLQSYFKPEAGEAAGEKVPYAPAFAIGWVWACSLDSNILELFFNWNQYLSLWGV
ncbi:prepilin peptidase [Shewanella psychropiezotolerans]|uniref:Prepilin peptidase n=1 Tax=Shewanella psychropiezotolerans TaxID=2593655 RepID=A0ABX5X1Y8_9GAMM|nr:MULTISPECIES: A24 family peptidase [Shewanella]MPY24608.1 prepilin peptidase [Shewanella sp. YLB-07]QDO83968.1 prepilin peptidase [Shewanella psychropiezotolerans]